MNPQIFTLKNGLQVIFVDTKAFPTLTTLLLVGAGSRYENKNNNGIAHFLEHMFFKGSKNYPTPEIVSSTIEGMGGVWNAFTSKHYTGYFIKAASFHFEKIVDILADILLNSKFEEKEIAKEKGVIIEEINMYEDQPQARVGELFENIIFAGSPLGMDVIGTKETVTAVSRKTIVNYMQQLYYPGNAVLVVAGGFVSSRAPKGRGDLVGIASSSTSSPSRNDMLQIIESKFSGWKNSKSSNFIKFDKTQTHPNILVYPKKTEQAHFCLGYQTFGIHDERKYGLAVLSTILGGGASSRLFVEIREKRGLCYYIHTGREHYDETGYIVTQAGVTRDEKKIKQAVGAIIKEHEKIAKEGVCEEELKRAKEMLKGRLFLSLEDSFNVANFFGMKELLEKTQETPEEAVAKIEKITTQEVVNLSQKLFQPEKLNFSLIGPFEEKDMKTSDFSSILSLK